MTSIRVIQYRSQNSLASLRSPVDSATIGNAST